MFPFVTFPVASLAQNNSLDTAQEPQVIRDLVQEGTAPEVTLVTVSFKTPPDDAAAYQYHTATILDRQIVSSNAHPNEDETGFITAQVIATLSYPNGEFVPENTGQTLLGARRRESSDWYFTFDLKEVNLRQFIGSLAVTMRQPREEDRQNGVRRQRRDWDGPLLRYDDPIPEGRQISIRAEYMPVSELLASIDQAAGCDVSMEGDTIVVHACR